MNRPLVPLLLLVVAAVASLQAASTTYHTLRDRTASPDARAELPLVRRWAATPDAPRGALWLRETLRGGLALALTAAAWALLRDRPGAGRRVTLLCATAGAALMADLAYCLLVEQPALVSLARGPQLRQARAVLVTRFATLLGQGLLLILAASLAERSGGAPPTSA